MLPPVAILAGGRATRMQPLTEHIPKALLDVNGAPFIVRQLDLLRRCGITRVVLCVGHLGEQIRAVLGTGASFDIALAYSFDGERLLGTAGALKQAQPLLGEEFFVLYGDSYLQVSYADVYETFVRSGMPALVTIHRNEGRWDTSNVTYKNGKLMLYDKSRPAEDMQYIDYGLGVLRSDALAAVRPGVPAELSDVYHLLSVRGQLAAYEAKHRFYEIGSPEGLQALRRHLTGQPHD